MKPAAVTEGRKEGNVLFNDANPLLLLQEGRKEMFYLTTHSTHFIYSYMVLGHSDSKR